MASTSQQSQEHSQADGSSEVKVTILASEWGSSKGGLSTINREFAIQLAKCPELEITFFLPRCSEEDKEIALCHNINLIEATQRPGYSDELEWLNFPPEHLQMDIIVSHGVKLGHQAQVIRESKKCKWVQVLHTDPEELGMLRNYGRSILKGQEEHKTEVELCKMADLVVGVGPKVTEAFRSYLRGYQKNQNLLDLTPGVFEELVSVEQVLEERKQFSILVFGCGDVQDFKVKGFDIAGEAVATLPNNTCLLFVGAPDGKLEEIAEWLKTVCGLPASRLRVRGSIKSLENLKCLLQEGDLVLMPSRSEGFGVTGLEALSAGLPVLISQNSGFGEALSKVPFGSSFVVDSEDPKVWAEAINRIWDKDRQGRLEEVETLRSSYDKKYSWGKQSKDLADKMISMVHENADLPKEGDTGLKRSAECLQDEGSVKTLKLDMQWGLSQMEEKQSSTIPQISREIANCETDVSFFAERYDPGTREWLFEDFYKWFGDPGDSRAYILLGDAGIGKSVMAGALAQRTKQSGQLVAAFFCCHNDKTRNDPRYLLGTIACQLCDCNSQYSRIVGGESGVKKMLADSTLGVRELFTKLLKEPLGKCSPSQQRKLVIIDALDETEYESREDFLDFIKECFLQLPKWLVFFITSRPEDTVQSRLEGYNPCVRICAGNSEQRSFYQQHEQDIKRFLENKVDFSSLPFSVEDVATKCNGLFLYAFFFVKLISDSVVRSGKIIQLSNLIPGSMDDFFRTNFQRVYDKVGADLYRKLFGCMITAPAPLPLSFISFVLNIENSTFEEQDVKDAVSLFVVQRTSDQKVTFLHNLIPAWLTNKRNARKLFIDKEAAGEYLKKIFIEILSDFDNEPTTKLPNIDEDLQEVVLHVVVQFLCQHGDKDSLQFVYRLLTCYRFLEKRMEGPDYNKKFDYLVEDLNLTATSCYTAKETQKQNVLEDIRYAFCVHFLVQRKCLYRHLPLCILNASDAVKENVWSAPWNFGRRTPDILSATVVAMSSDEKILVGALENRFLLIADAATLETIGGPFDVSVDKISETLTFSPEDKFVFFGRLDKWFSLEQRCVVDLPQFSGNLINYKQCLFTRDNKHIHVETYESYDIDFVTCRDKICIVDLLALWAVHSLYNKDKDFDSDGGVVVAIDNSLDYDGDLDGNGEGDGDDYDDDDGDGDGGDNGSDDGNDGVNLFAFFFPQLSETISKIKIPLGEPTKRLLELLKIDLKLCETCDIPVSYDPTCDCCRRFTEITESDQEPSLAAVFKLVRELYPRISQFQVWDFEKGVPVLQDECWWDVSNEIIELLVPDNMYVELFCEPMSVRDIAVHHAVLALTKLGGLAVSFYSSEDLAELEYIPLSDDS